jgi:hypothetical protein
VAAGMQEGSVLGFIRRRTVVGRNALCLPTSLQQGEIQWHMMSRSSACAES